MLFSFFAPMPDKAGASAAPAAAIATPTPRYLTGDPTDPATRTLAGLVVEVAPVIAGMMLHGDDPAALAGLGFDGEDAADVADYLERLLLAQVSLAAKLARQYGQPVVAPVEYYDRSHAGNPRRTRVVVEPTADGVALTLVQ